MSRVSGTAEPLHLMILRGELAAGEHVVEFKLVQRLRVRRPTLREALDRSRQELWNAVVVAGAAA
jgi:DNA-binding GntR family transcriptional regulator